MSGKREESVVFSARSHGAGKKCCGTFKRENLVSIILPYFHLPPIIVFKARPNTTTRRKYGTLQFFLLARRLEGQQKLAEE
jgi:hypothetical protein